MQRAGGSGRSGPLRLVHPRCHFHHLHPQCHFHDLSFLSNLVLEAFVEVFVEVLEVFMEVLVEALEVFVEVLEVSMEVFVVEALAGMVEVLKIFPGTHMRRWL